MEINYYRIFKMLIAFLALFFTFISISSAVTSEIPKIEWSEQFGGNAKEIGSKVLQTTDGGFIAVGLTSSFGNKEEVYVVKTDSEGNEEWNKTYGGVGFDGARDIGKTSDDGYVIVGYTSSFNVVEKDIYVIKTDAEGNIEWYKTYDDQFREEGYSIVQTSGEEKGYAILGHKIDSNMDIWLLKIDETGNVLWDKTFGGDGKDQPYSMKRTNDGGFVIAGYTDSMGEGGGDAYAIKTDAEGNKLWERTYGGNGIDVAYDIEPTSDGGYIMAGNTESFDDYRGDIYIVKTDSNGNEEWHKTIGDKKEDSAYSVKQTSDGGYIVAGTTEISNDETAGWIIKLDPSGTQKWNIMFKGFPSEELYSVQQSDDGGYVLSGLNSKNMDLWLVKLESEKGLEEKGTPAQTETETTMRTDSPEEQEVGEKETNGTPGFLITPALVGLALVYTFLRRR